MEPETGSSRIEMAGTLARGRYRRNELPEPGSLDTMIAPPLCFTMP
jgi:hypothetical protein